MFNVSAEGLKWYRSFVTERVLPDERRKIDRLSHEEGE